MVIIEEGIGFIFYFITYKLYRESYEMAQTNRCRLYADISVVKTHEPKKLVFRMMYTVVCGVLYRQNSWTDFNKIYSMVMSQNIFSFIANTILLFIFTRKTDTKLGFYQIWTHDFDQSLFKFSF